MANKYDMPDIIFSVPASRKFSVQLVYLNTIFNYQTHKLIQNSTTRKPENRLICVFDS